MNIAEERRPLEKCLHRLEDKKDLVGSAKCLVGARKRRRRSQPQQPARAQPRAQLRTDWVGGFRTQPAAPTRRQLSTGDIRLVSRWRGRCHGHLMVVGIL